MRRLAAVSAGVLLVGLLLVGIALRSDPLATSRTTWGVHPQGHRAVYELLGELGIPRQRSHVPAASLPGTVTLWWLEPDDPCRGVEEGRLETGTAQPWRALPWLEQGGTGVLFLPAHGLPCLVEAELDGQGVPWRPVDAGEESMPAEIPRERAPVPLHESVLDRPRTLPGPLHVFEEAGSGTTRAWAAPGAFVVEQQVGAGRLVWVADVRPLHNARLDAHDAAPFVVDLVAEWGAPRFDERAHGLLPPRSPWRYLATSPALPALLGVVGLAGLLAWAGHAVPRPGLPEEPETAPTLHTFVDSLAALYARTRDHGAVLARYREVTAARIRRGLHLPPETGLAGLIDALARRGVPPERARARLADADAVRSRAELLARARELDALVEEVAG
ncbi:MAG: hypothetical protein R3263_05360 [Myxococcota bacterium]|nr:hypothetical protein [Myxococcota bacterium]